MFASLCCVILLLALGNANEEHSLSKRVLPTNEHCDPQAEVCRKGDWTATYIADCERRGLFTCNAENDVWFSWTVDVAENDKCKPVTGRRFDCGEPGTDTRCVCSDYKIQFNECRCQYWPTEDPGVSIPAPCTGYYVGGKSGVHHWACCNNCNDPANSCDAATWQGGSTIRYCDACGTNTGGGRVKYYFNCGGCNEQRGCEEYCTNSHFDHLGLCWRWLDCFKGCCLQETEQPSRNKRQIGTTPFCGDGTCSGEESPTTCPSDCCYKMNSACASNSNICAHECCGHSSCCLEGATSSAAAGMEGPPSSYAAGIYFVATLAVLLD